MQPESRAALGHILKSAERIRDKARGRTLADYELDEDLRAIVERHFIIVGEAFTRIAKHDADLFESVPSVRSIVAFRNVLVHGYDVIANDQVWDAVTQDVDLLVTTIKALLAE